MSKLEQYLCAISRRIFRLFPIDRRKVVFCSYYGKGYSDNPKAVAEAQMPPPFLLGSVQPLTGASAAHGSCLLPLSGWTTAGRESGENEKDSTTCKPGMALP